MWLQVKREGEGIRLMKLHIPWSRSALLPRIEKKKFSHPATPKVQKLRALRYPITYGQLGNLTQNIWFNSSHGILRLGKRKTFQSVHLFSFSPIYVVFFREIIYL